MVLPTTSDIIRRAAPNAADAGIKNCIRTDDQTGYVRTDQTDESDKSGTCGNVDMAEVDMNGKKISDLSWRYIYQTKYHKEYICGI